MNHLLSLFQLALPPRSDVPEDLSPNSNSKVDPQSDRDPYDKSLDLVDPQYVDPEYAELSMYEEDVVTPEASDDPSTFVMRNEVVNYATDPVLETFVRNAMTSKDLSDTRSIESLASNSMEVLRSLVVMILDNLSGRENLNDQQEMLTLELQNLLYAMGRSIAEYAQHKILIDYSSLHELLWDSVYILGMYSKRDLHGRVSDNLEDIILSIKRYRDNIVERLTANANIDYTSNPAELQARIHLRPDMSSVQLDLTHPGRVVLYRGNIFGLIQGSKWQEIHVFLFDNYLVQAKPSRSPHRNENAIDPDYDVTKLPIPMYLLILDSPYNEAPQKNANAVSESSGMIWPFRIRHLGHNDVYTFGTLTPEGRRDWCSRIIEGKTQHARSLQEQKAEPFQVTVIADTAFATSNSPVPSSTEMSSEEYKTTIIEGTPLSQAIQLLDEEYRFGIVEPTSISRGNVNCATLFRQPQDGAQVVVVGDTYGVYITDFNFPFNSPRNWTRVSSQLLATQFPS